MSFHGNIWPVRLATHGPFVNDYASRKPLLLGPGSTGLIVRAQGISGSTQAIGTTSALATIVAGLGNIAVSLPSGYLYDIKCALYFDAPNTATDVGFATYFAVQFSDDSGVTWQLFPLSIAPGGLPRINDPVVCQGHDVIELEEIGIDRRVATLATITNLRVLVWSPGGGGTMTVQSEHCRLRVEMYCSQSATA